MFHIILYQPEIPQNTGNIGRLCAISNCRLHLIHPLGFDVSDKAIRRSGMDYWHQLDLVEHSDWESFLTSKQRPERIWLFSTKAEQDYWAVEYARDDGLLFGNEGSGVPQKIHDWVGKQRVCIPHYNEAMRSINLATSVGIATYEALRQCR